AALDVRTGGSMRFRKSLKRAWGWLRRRPKLQLPVQSVDVEELRRAQLKRIFLYTEISLAHDNGPREPEVLFIPQPCTECLRRAIQTANWQLELESELNALTQKLYTTADEQETRESQWEVTETN